MSSKRGERWVPEGGQEVDGKIEKEGVGINLGHFMGHSGLKTGLNERIFTAQSLFNTKELYSQIQPNTATPRLTRAPLMPHTTHKDCQWAWKKQPEKANHSSLADFIVKLHSLFM